MHVLNEKQRGVLRWVAEGCPDGVMSGYTHRVSAAALRSRGLLRVTGRGPTWHAEVTDAGRTLLDELGRGSGTRHGQPPAEASSDSSPPRDQAPEQSALALRRTLKTEDLVAAVVEAGGTLTLPDQTNEGGVDWRQRAYAAQRHARVPVGKHLRVSRSAGMFEIQLVDGGTGNELGAHAVPVPARVRVYHPAVQQFRDATSVHEISRKTLPRALRIMHGIATEIDRRGYSIRCCPAGADRDEYRASHRRAGDRAHFSVDVNGHEFALRLTEKGVGLRGPWEARKQRREENREALRFDRWDVGRIEPFDKGATGQLDLAIGTYGPRQTKWGDRKRWSLEDRLPQVLRELEVLAEEAEARRVERERQEAERRRAWEAAMATAQERAIEHHHVEILQRRVAAWKQAEEIRAYCDAVEQRHRIAVAEDPESQRWIEFARNYADRLQAQPRMPADPELRHEDLKPFLGGWSPYGPERRGW
jgi:hypothetical protein